ncbi:MAG TPA: hypothetical protein VFR20_03615 [Burkholderiaceae bacterium]|nr:hypothetical protein [Burkholderiaceae bacterium]
MSYLQVDLMHGWPLMAAAFMASLVEFVEALTIVLAVGVARGWRDALSGSLCAVLVLAGIVALVGPALLSIPMDSVRLLIGLLALLFGMRWLRKAILRTAGVIALHDEATAYARQSEMLARTNSAPRGGVDLIAFATAFQAVLLEGLEVVFIVIAVGASESRFLPPTVGAGAALVVVVALGAILHRPLLRVPENTLKFAVGVLLCAFGAFWLGEGMGLRWPGEDWSIAGLAAGFLVLALLCVRWARRVSKTLAEGGRP